MKKISLSKIIILPFFSLIAISLIAVSIVIANTDPSTWYEGYRIDSGETIMSVKYGNASGVYVASNICSYVNNASANDYFIPTKSSTEFNYFKSNLPSGASVCCEYSGCVESAGDEVNCFGKSNCCQIPDITVFNGVRDGGVGWGDCVDTSINACECRERDDGTTWCADYSGSISKTSCLVGPN